LRSNGNDTVQVSLGNDQAFGELGNDVVRGLRVPDRLNDGDGADRLFGDQINGALLGGPGTDSRALGLPLNVRVRLK
jgi:Ca2+-binding RTX toxin-like protein